MCLITKWEHPEIMSGQNLEVYSKISAVITTVLMFCRVPEMFAKANSLRFMDKLLGTQASMLL